MSHSRAKLNALGRQLLIARIVNEHWPVAAAARAQGISRARTYVLLARYLVEGAAAFVPRSSRPYRSPRRLGAAVERRIERERRRRRWGPLRLSWLLGMARSTIYAVLRRIGLARRRDLDPRPPRSRRYERDVPGDLLHIDTKKLGRLPEGGGKRAGVHLVRNRLRAAGRGWEHLHLAVDDRTRVLYAERLATDGADDAAGFLARAVAYFADRGIRVRQVMTDNAFSYVHGRLWHAVREAWGIEHVRIPAYTPRWNGKAEAAVGILLREWAYARAYTSNRARAAAFPHFVHSYNHRRPHGELGGLTPMQRLLADVNNVRGQHS